MPIDPIAIFRQAVAFELATFELAANVKARRAAFRVPMVVNSAFSLELYLKCLLHIEGKAAQAKGHELRKLYDRLDQADKSKVVKRFGEEMKTNPVMQNIFAAEKARKLPTLPWGIGDILDRSNLAFARWRYSFELARNDMVYAGAQPIRDAVRAVILELRPSWPKDREQVM